MLEKTIEKYIKNFYLFNDGIYTLIFLYMPYKRYKHLGRDYLTIDAFYVASNELYHLSKKLKEELAVYECEELLDDIKSIYEKYQIGARLKNSLIALPKYGSSVALSILKIKHKTNNILPLKLEKCCNCNLCIKACPTNALDDKFCREKCLRNGQDTLDAEKNDFKLLENSILGCDKCQRVCPLNQMEEEEMPDDLKEILKIDNFKNLATGGRKNLKVLEKYIGKNMVRINKMLFLEKYANKQE